MTGAIPDHDRLVRTVAEQFLQMPTPKPGRRLVFQVSGDLPPVRFKRPTLQRYAAAIAKPNGVGGGSGDGGEDDMAWVAREWAAVDATAVWAAPPLLSWLGAECLMQTLAVLMCELQLFVVGGETGHYSSTVLALAAFLRPVLYVYPIIPILPKQMETVLHAPVPLLIGVAGPYLSREGADSGDGGGISGAGAGAGAGDGEGAAIETPVAAESGVGGRFDSFRRQSSAAADEFTRKAAAAMAKAAAKIKSGGGGGGGGGGEIYDGGDDDQGDDDFPEICENGFRGRCAPGLAILDLKQRSLQVHPDDVARGCNSLPGAHELYGPLHLILAKFRGQQPLLTAPRYAADERETALVPKIAELLTTHITKVCEHARACDPDEEGRSAGGEGGEEGGELGVDWGEGEVDLLGQSEKAFIDSFLSTQLYDVFKRSPPPPPPDYMVHLENPRASGDGEEGGNLEASKRAESDPDAKANEMLALIGDGGDNGDNGDGGDGGGRGGESTPPHSHASPFDDGMEEVGFVNPKFNLKIDLSESGRIFATPDGLGLAHSPPKDRYRSKHQHSSRGSRYEVADDGFDGSDEFDGFGRPTYIGDDKAGPTDDPKTPGSQPGLVVTRQLAERARTGAAMDIAPAGLRPTEATAGTSSSGTARRTGKSLRSLRSKMRAQTQQVGAAGESEEAKFSRI